MQSYRRLLSYLRPYRLYFFGALGCMVLFGASEGGIPFLIKHILDGIFAEKDEGLLYVLPAVVFGFVLLRAGLDFSQQYLMAKIGHWIVRDIRHEINSHLLRLSPAYFIANSSGSLLSRITSDVMLVKTVLTESVASVIRDSIRILALLVAAFWLDAVLAAIAFVAFPLAIYPVYRFGKRIRRLSKRGQDAIGSISGLLQESIVGNKVVKVFGREEFERSRFREQNNQLTNTFIKSEKIRALTGPVNEVLAAAAISGVILYGGYSVVVSGTRSQGDFIAFLTAVFLLYEPFKKLSRVHNNIQLGMSGADRIFEILDTAPRIVDPEQPKIFSSTANHITFAGVSFRYPGAETEALKEIELSIPEGSKVALVGFSGSGKSSLVSLIPRFIDPDSGSVRIADTDIREVSLQELRSRIAMVDQHTFLFNDTIYHNIAYGHENASREGVIRASQAAQAHEFISQLPLGYDTVVGEGGMTLSGGERQRIAIARAILKDAPILILDEATASLDNRSEREVQKALRELERERTSIVIAHRLSTVLDADQIVVMAEGRIVERGSHEELLARNGEYRKLYQLQFSPQEESSEEENIESVV